MKRLFYTILLIISTALAGCTYIETAEQLSEFDIIFDMDEIVINTGETLEIPFTVTGRDGVALDFTPSVDNNKITVKLAKIDYEKSQGVIKVITPKNLSKDIEAQVFLSISDSHGRKLTRFVDLKVIANGGPDEPDNPTDPTDPTNPEYGDLGIFYDMDDPSINPGQTLEIPFTVTGSEGVTLDLVPAVDNEEFQCKLGRVDYVNYVGTIKITAPEIITQEMEVKVSLTASDTHNRSITKSIKVKVTASAVPEIVSLGDPSSMAGKARSIMKR